MSFWFGMYIVCTVYYIAMHCVTYIYGAAVLHLQRMHTQVVRKSMNLDELAIQMVSLGANQLFLLSSNENSRSEAF